MEFAEDKDIFKAYRILTKGEALERRVLLSCAIGALILPPIIMPGTRQATLMALCFPFIYSLWLIFMPKKKTKTEDAQKIKIEEQKPAGATPADLPVYDAGHEIGKGKAKVGRLAFLLSPWFLKAVGVGFSILMSAVAASFLTSFSLTIIAINALALAAGLSFLMFSSAMDFIEKKALAKEYPSTFFEKTIAWINKTFTHSKGFYLMGEYKGKKIGLERDLRFKHVLICGPTGQYKSSGLMIPQLLFDADSPGSAVAPDAKSPEIYNKVASRWLQAGKKVFLFDPWNAHTIGINPLPDADDEDIITIVEVLLREKEDEVGREDPFFKGRTRYLLYSMLKMVQGWKDEYCNLASLFKLTESVSTLEEAINTSDENVKRLFDDFTKKMAKETQMNALQSIRAKLDVFMDPSVRKAFTRADFKPEMLFREGEPCLLLIGAPVDREEHGAKIASLLVNLIVNMAFREGRAQNEALQRGERAFMPNDLYLYLDELRKLKITRFPDLVSIARSIRISVVSSITDLGFLKHYRENFTSLITNHRTKIFLRGMDYESARYVSESLGKVERIAYRFIRGVVASKEPKLLMSPDKVYDLPDSKMIAFSSKTRPFIAKQVSSYTTKWIRNMEMSPPKNLKEFYASWGIPAEDLHDVELPRVDNRFLDMAKIRDARKEVKVDSRYDMERVIREAGGGKVVIDDGKIMPPEPEEKPADEVSETIVASTDFPGFL